MHYIRFDFGFLNKFTISLSKNDFIRTTRKICTHSKLQYHSVVFKTDSKWYGQTHFFWCEIDLCIKCLLCWMSLFVLRLCLFLLVSLFVMIGTIKLHLMFCKNTIETEAFIALVGLRCVCINYTTSTETNIVKYFGLQKRIYYQDTVQS